MTITNRDLMNLKAAMDALGMQSYKLPVKVHYAVIKNQRLIKGHLEDYETARRKAVSLVIDKYYPAADKPEMIDAGAPGFKEASEAIEELLNTEVSVDIHQIAFEMLNVDVNPIPVGVTNALVPMISDFNDSDTNKEKPDAN